MTHAEMVSGFLAGFGSRLKRKKEPKKDKPKKDKDPAPFSPTKVDDSTFAAKLQEAIDKYEGKEGELDRREMAEMIGNALGKIGGGLAGKGAGVDVSGAEFKTRDWEAKRDRNLRKYMADQGTVREGRQAAAQQARHEDLGSAHEWRTGGQRPAVLLHRRKRRRVQRVGHSVR